MPTIWIDADACPVKDEVYAVAVRHRLRVVLVANQAMYTPTHADVSLIVVGREPDAADDWIAERAEASDIVVTADILLAARCLERGALVIGTDGRVFTNDTIGDALAGRQLHADLRGQGMTLRGPPALSQRDRSRFASQLDALARRTSSAGD
jgi:uncharacterized protein